jgi:YVTN family beta-propeller protein
VQDAAEPVRLALMWGGFSQGDCGDEATVALPRAALAVLLLLGAGSAFADRLRIIQTNESDEVIHLIDPETHTIVEEIRGIPANHGVAAAPDGSRLYFSSEAKQSLFVVDGRSLEIVAEIALSSRPHNISIDRDGRHVYVGIMGGPGGIDIVDTGKLERTGRIETGSRVHNTYVTPDGRYLVAGSFRGARNLQVFAVATLRPVMSLFPPRVPHPMEGVRPIAFELEDDGSVDRMFVQVSGLHGFVAVDFASGREVARMGLPNLPPIMHDKGPFNSAPAHGIGVAPDGSTLWVCSTLQARVYAYSLPELDLLGEVKVGNHPYWMTFTPDSRFVYVSNGVSNDVSVIEVATRKEVKRIPVGKEPKRNLTVRLP